LTRRCRRTGLDAEIVLLAHHAKMLQPEIIAHHGIEVGE
jgi:hypothetical protein